MTERHRLERELTRHALYDSLTGLPNRLLLTDRLVQALTVSLRKGSPLSLLFIDIDQFKTVNDAAGHLVGDELLVGVANRLSAVARATDTVARFGGDEFVIICSDTDLVEAKHIPSRVAAALAAPMMVGGQAMYASVSIGIAMRPPLEADATALLRNADTAMYEAKARGRARFEVFDVDAPAGPPDQWTLTSDLHDALRQDLLEVHYQPVVDLASGQLRGLEALVRWQHPVHGWVPPASFVPLAEANGLSTALDRWVLAHAGQDFSTLRAQGLVAPDATIAVNISAHTASDPEFVAVVQETARHGRIPIELFVLEVTETATMSNPPAARRVLESLRALGAGIALDDFGTGYSSLTLLQQMAVSLIKIDQSFIRGVTEESGDRAIVTGVIALANALNLPTVAEGIEHRSQMDAVKQMGCTYGQGYLWSKPLPLTELRQLITNRDHTWQTPARAG